MKKRKMKRRKKDEKMRKGKKKEREKERKKIKKEREARAEQHICYVDAQCQHIKVFHFPVCGCTF